MPLFDLFRGKRPKPKPKEKPKKDLAALVEEFRRIQTIANLAGSSDPNGVPRSLLMDLKEAEQEVIVALEDPLQRKIFGILAKHQFNLLLFLDEDLTGGKDWKEVLGSIFQTASSFLGKACFEGRKQEDYPVTGKELYFQLLQRAKGSERKERLVSIFSVLEKDYFYDVPLDIRARRDLSYVFLVVFLGKYAKESAAFLDIICDVPGGEEFIKEKLMTRV